MTSPRDGAPRTHLAIDRGLCGEPSEIGPGRAHLTWTASEAAAADDRGLVHGGFVFGVADYAAMLAVNEPTVVLVSADTQFRRPVRVGDCLQAEAVVVDSEGGRHRVDVSVKRADEVVMSGVFHCVVTGRHVLEPVP